MTLEWVISASSLGKLLRTLAQIIQSWLAGFVGCRISKVMAHRPDLVLGCGLFAWPILLLVDLLFRAALERLRWRLWSPSACDLHCLSPVFFSWLLWQPKIASQFLGKSWRSDSYHIVYKFSFISSISFLRILFPLFFLVSLMKNQVFP